jgi:alpha(1,3/1,4) fucosyltransferase
LTVIGRYITEKLLNAFSAGCLPIYFGTREVFNVFNEDAFVFYDTKHPEQALDKIMFLEENPAAYFNRLSAPILKNGSTTIDDFFSIFPNIGNGSLNRKIRQMMGLKQLSK